MAKLFSVKRLDGSTVWVNPLHVVRVAPGAQQGWTTIIQTAGPHGGGGPGVARQPGEPEQPILVVEEAINMVVARVNQALSE